MRIMFKNNELNCGFTTYDSPCTRHIIGDYVDVGRLWCVIMMDSV